MNTLETYAALAETCHGIVLANEIEVNELELINGVLSEDEEIFQFYVVDDPTYLLHHTNELVFCDRKSELYIWGITHFGTSWDCVKLPSY